MNAKPQNQIGRAGPDQAAVSRRGFLRDCVRYPLLAGLLALGGVLALRRRDPLAIEPCVKQRVCRGCRLLDDCALPQAEATRRKNS